MMGFRISIRCCLPQFLYRNWQYRATDLGLHPACRKHLHYNCYTTANCLWILCKDVFYVPNTDAVNDEIYDFSGKLMLTGKIVDQKVSAQKMQNGIYIIKIIMKDGSAISKKMIKQ